jgi:hypothetical protein
MKEYLKGLLYGAAFYMSLSKDKDMNAGGQIMLWLNDGSYLTFAINRGIAHKYGNEVAVLTQEQSCNYFDITANWVSYYNLKKIIDLGYDDIDYYGECRLTFDELVNVIETLGGVDIELTEKEWLKVYLNKYYKQN